jgi:hypothetical protein
LLVNALKYGEAATYVGERSRTLAALSYIKRAAAGPSALLGDLKERNI